LPRLHDPKTLIVTAFGVSGNGGKTVRNWNALQEADGHYGWFQSRSCPLFDRMEQNSRMKLRQNEMELCWHAVRPSPKLRAFVTSRTFVIQNIY
jgi:hypothetical protein